MDTQEFKYTIGENKYVQRKLVFAQIAQLEKALTHIVIPPDLITRTGDINLVSILRSFISSNILVEGVAIVLRPEGVPIKAKDLKALTEDLAFDLDIETATQVVEDFFDCNPISSVLEKLTEKLTALKERVENQVKEIKDTGLTKPSASSQAEISPNEMKSTGASDPTNQSTTLNSGAGSPSSESAS